MIDCSWLPQLEYYNSNEQWEIYENKLYDIFKMDFINSPPNFKGNRVVIRKHPKCNDKEEAFYHVTCQDYMKDGQREPDWRRCERIRWVKAFIENYQCRKTTCIDCDGVKVWNKPDGNKSRIHILLENERYIVVLEPRTDYCLLITAFYIEYDNALIKKLKEYNTYK